MQDKPVNSLTSKSDVVQGTDATTDSTASFVYDYGTLGAGSGKIWGTDGKVVIK
jgi:hypothetical protein